MAVYSQSIADGHVGTLKWCVERFAGDEHPTVTVIGWLGPRYVHHAAHMPGASKAGCERLCAALLAEPVKVGASKR